MTGFEAHARNPRATAVFFSVSGLFTMQLDHPPPLCIKYPPLPPLYQVIVTGFEAHARNPRATAVARSVLHASIFQAVATMFLPALVIHNVVHSSESTLLNAGAATTPTRMSRP